MKVLWFAVGAIVVGTVVLLVFPRWGAGPEAAEAAETVYLCSETQELVRAALQATPAVHPETGRPTLLRALYCDKCRRWHAVPPPDAYNGNPLAYPCPKHRAPMTPDGPLE